MGLVARRATSSLRPYYPKTTRGDIWILPLEEGTKPRPFLASAANEYFARFSPDEQWVAYVSNESGRDDVYVRELTPNGAGGKWPVSTSGGIGPRWRGDGKELFYDVRDYNLEAGKLMAVDVSIVRGEFHAGPPKRLFAGVGEGGGMSRPMAVASWLPFRWNRPHGRRSR